MLWITSRESGTTGLFVAATSPALAKPAAPIDVESSAENPKNDERTKREPGGKKFGTCSEIGAWLKKRRRSAT